MITLNTYNKLQESIIEEINTVISTKTTNDLNQMCEEIFNIISSNILYADIYAKLYKDLINKFSIFNDILIKNLSELNNKINNIQYCDPEKDYNKFCENNKNNELLRANCTFYINLMKENIIDELDISNIILNLFNLVHTMINNKTKKNELDELVEIIYIFIINSYELIKKRDDTLANNIYEHVLQITKLKVKENEGITNKCIFKYMDILDEISEFN